MRGRDLLLLGLPILAVGCVEGREIALRDASGAEARYECPPTESKWSEPSARGLVRDHAILIIQAAAETGSWSGLETLQQAYDADDGPTLEREVVRYVCEHGLPLVETGPPVFPDSGSAVPSFAMNRMAADGSRTDSIVTLEGLRGEFALLDFFATWCVPCVEKYPELREGAAALEREGVRVYGVTHHEAPQITASWLAEHHGGLAFPFLVDRGGYVAERLRVRGIPHVFLIGPGGELLARCARCTTDLSHMTVPELLELVRGVRKATPRPAPVARVHRHDRMGKP